MHVVTNVQVTQLTRVTLYDLFASTMNAHTITQYMLCFTFKIVTHVIVNTHTVFATSFRDVFLMVA
jgi:hypothetical protein